VVGLRCRLAFAVTCGAIAGYLLRSEAQRRLARLAERSGERLLLDIPHQVASEDPWPGCWCEEPEGDPVHQGTGSRQ